jgi:hypothetical protein
MPSVYLYRPAREPSPSGRRSAFSMQIRSGLPVYHYGMGNIDNKVCGVNNICPVFFHFGKNELQKIKNWLLLGKIDDGNTLVE